MKENQQIEWKETWRDEFLKWICGFANAEGGALHIGRNDRGAVVGVPNAARLLEEIPNKVRDLLGILVEVNLRREGGGEYLEVVTPAYPSPISYRGHYYPAGSGSSVPVTSRISDSRAARWKRPSPTEGSPDSAMGSTPWRVMRSPSTTAWHNPP